MYRHLIWAGATALLALPIPAAARDGAAYVVAGLGLTDVQSIEWEISNKPHQHRTNFHTGQFDTSLVGGYDFGNIRAEGEVIFQRNRIHDYTMRVPTKMNELPTIPAGFYPKTTGYVHRASVMANIVAERGGNKRVGIYGGVGAGLTRGRLDNWRIAGVDPFLKGDSTRFAWQTFAGVRVPVTRHIEIGAKFRYHAGRNFKYVSRQGKEPFKGDISSQSWLLTAGWNF